MARLIFKGSTGRTAGALRTAAILLAPVLMATVLMATAACSGSGEAARSTTTTAAPPPEVLVVYSERDESEIGPLLDRFSESTGIAIDFRDAPGRNLLGVLAAQPDARVADVDVVISDSLGTMAAAEKQGLLAELSTRVLDRVGEEYRSATGAWVGLGGKVRVFAISPAAGTTGPTTIEALLSPDLSGQVGYAPEEPSFVDSVSALIATKGEGAATTWLSKFAANAPQKFASGDQVIDAVRAGAVKVGVTDSDRALSYQLDVGAETATVANTYSTPGDPGGLFTLWAAGIPSTSAEPTAAAELIEALIEGSSSAAGNDTEGGPSGGSATTDTKKPGSTSAAGRPTSTVVDSAGPGLVTYPTVDGEKASPDLPTLSKLKPLRVDPGRLDDPDRARKLIAAAGLASP